MDITKKNTKRANFTPNERLILSAILSEQMHIIENKKANTATSKLKEETWGKVATQFNASTTDGTQRTSLQLRTLYQNQKKLGQKVFHHISPPYLFPNNLINCLN